MRFILANILTAVMGLIVLQACQSNTAQTVATPTSADAFWELQRGSRGGPFSYLRTQSSGSDKILLFDPCTNRISGEGVRVGKDYEIQVGNSTLIATLSGDNLVVRNGLDVIYNGIRRDLSYTCIDNKPTQIRDHIAADEPIFSIGCTSAQDGCQHIAAAAASLLPNSNDVKVQNAAKYPVGERPPDYPAPGTGVSAIKCSSDLTPTTDAKDLSEMTLLSTNALLYPGSLVRGSSFAVQGLLAPITATRAGGRITMTNIVFSKDALYFKDLPVVGEGTVQTAIQQILQENSIQGQVANGNHIETQVQSSSQLEASLDVDARYKNFELEASFALDSTSNSNAVMLKFTQIFYTVSFEDPSTPYDVFADKQNFHDPENQISDKDPPLYVKEVSYGRTILFMTKSSESALDIRAALKVAYDDGAGDGVSIDARTHAKNVLNNSDLSYFIMGGGAEQGFHPIGAAAGEMYDQVKKLITDGTTVSPSNPGIPITFKLSYLSTQAPAAMGYASTYYNRNCQQVTPSLANYVVDVKSPIDGAVRLYVDGVLQLGPVSAVPFSWDLGSLNLIPKDSKDHVVEIEIDNVGCGHTWADWKITRFQDTATPNTVTLPDPNPPAGQSHTTDPGIMTDCNIAIGRYSFTVNRDTGVLTPKTSCQNNLGC